MELEFLLGTFWSTVHGDHLHSLQLLDVSQHRPQWMHHGGGHPLLCQLCYLCVFGNCQICLKYLWVPFIVYTKITNEVRVFIIEHLPYSLINSVFIIIAARRIITCQTSICLEWVTVPKEWTYSRRMALEWYTGNVTQETSFLVRWCYSCYCLVLQSQKNRLGLSTQKPNG